LNARAPVKDIMEMLCDSRADVDAAQFCLEQQEASAARYVAEHIIPIRFLNAFG
jgi:hypothetical protein